MIEFRVELPRQF